jgi:hypothetical protein
MMITSKSLSDRLFCSPGRHHKAHAIVAVDAAGGPELRDVEETTASWVTTTKTGPKTGGKW